MPKQKVSFNQGWRYRACDDADPENWRPSQPLPTSIHLDLLANGAIPDPFLAQNENLVQWVGQKSWIYENRFKFPSNLYIHKPDQRMDLVFEGLDTYTTVTLDGKVILETNNMFLSHRVDITDHFQPSFQIVQDETHVLQITFHNAEERATKEMENHPENSWFSFHFGNSRLATRKAQYHYGWDWGPKLTDCGPWKPIYLEAYQSRIVDLAVQTNLGPDHMQATINITFKVDGKADCARIEIYQEAGNVQSRTISMNDEAKASTVVQIQDPKLWWPWTLGEQNLYVVRVTLFNKNDPVVVDSRETVLDVLEKKIGIRKLDLVRRPLRNQQGSSFFFRVNDIPIFASGSCWIPSDSFIPRMTDERYRRWIQLAKDTNQIMIRVWGGGIYEQDAFFDACDELGILVWHDFMFACGIYPAYPTFEETVVAEARQNIIRMRHHPSIALWCGNNEDYAIAHIAKILMNKVTYDPTETDPEKIKESEFPARLFYEILLPEVCKELVPDVPYWPSSPFGGSFCNDTTDGDIHQWHVWHLDKFPYQNYPQLVGRFVSEFGLQSIPHYNAVKKYYPADQIPALDDCRNYTTDEHMVWHNKGKGGPENILKYGEDNISFDDQSLRGYIYCSQLIQSEGISTALRGWRRQWQGPGREYCGGALLWQLNDCWPVSSWAIADSDLRPKIAYWAVKRENRLITVALARKFNNDSSLELEAWASNMTLHQLHINYEVQAWHVKTGRKLWNHKVSTSMELPPNRSTELGKIEFSTEMDGGPQYNWNEVVFVIHLFSEADQLPIDESFAETHIIARCVNFHEPLKEVPLVNEGGG
ncbi:glycoside hydrolase superfamily [Talaromyces proteolyticus]|uniref:Beta-mannosidase B n=1 Tax=Talaromyces proteolyticus TaxID=1131652 RepID=A0AAD4KW98_9EURO|nr:glycoside hydrolase superfamily [Talaromyces proteolyticus]KAH8701559.1 glycoside hydrolase superfamily [Talaromyces proteolyticus]